MRIILEVNHKEVKAKLEQLATFTATLNESLRIYKEYDVTSAEQLLNKYKAMSGFTNNEMVLEAYNISKIYKTLLIAEQIDTNYISLVENEYKITAENTKALEEKFTLYLSEDDSKVYLKLDKLCTLLNELNGADRYLNKTFTGYVVNKMALHNKM